MICHEPTCGGCYEVAKGVHIHPPVGRAPFAQKSETTEPEPEKKPGKSVEETVKEMRRLKKRLDTEGELF